MHRRSPRTGRARSALPARPGRWQPDAGDERYIELLPLGELAGREQHGDLGAGHRLAARRRTRGPGPARPEKLPSGDGRQSTAAAGQVTGAPQGHDRVRVARGARRQPVGRQQVPRRQCLQRPQPAGTVLCHSRPDGTERQVIARPAVRAFWHAEGTRSACQVRNPVRQAGLEPATRCLEGSRSIRLSYWRSVTIVHGEDHASATLRSQSAGLVIQVNIPNVCPCRSLHLRLPIIFHGINV
jgi:hypothetical protein